MRSWSTLFACCLLVFMMSSLSAGEDPPKQPDATDDAAKDPRRELFEERTVSDGQGNSLPYRLLLPANYDPNGRQRYPVVLFLHGAGERGSDNQAQLRHGALEFATAERREKYPCYVIVPQCPKDQKWVDVDWDTPADQPIIFPEAPGIPLHLAHRAVIELTAEERVDRARIYVTGLSMGGYGTWAAVAYYPDQFSAAIPICGGGDTRLAERYQSIPIWAFHGSDDQAVPVSRSREMIAALTAAGTQPEPKYTEYPGVGHNSWTRTYANDQIYEWMFKQSRSVSW